MFDTLHFTIQSLFILLGVIRIFYSGGVERLPQSLLVYRGWIYMDREMSFLNFVAISALDLIDEYLKMSLEHI